MAPDAAASFSGLPEVLQARLRGALRPGEQLLWVGQPSAGAVFRRAFAAWLIALPILALCANYLGQVFGQAIDVIDLLFILFCLIMMLACVPVLHLPWRRRRNASYTVYAVTGDRALALDGVRYEAVRSFARTRGPDFRCVERSNGSGDLVFELDRSVDEDGERTTEAGFFAIDKVGGVAALFAASNDKGEGASLPDPIKEGNPAALRTALASFFHPK